MKKLYLLLPLAIIILIGAIFWVNKKGRELSQPINFIEATQPIIMDNPELSNPQKKIATITDQAPNDETLLAKNLNAVPFSSQAPYAKWDKLHNEACEEASIIMTYNYLIETEKIEISEAENEIQKMVAFQKTYFGSHKDLNAQEIIDLVWEFYKKKYYLVELTEPKLGKTLTEESSEEDFSKEKIQENENENFLEKIEYIKKELSKGNIFIAPAAGQELDNPYFRVPGPLYHALVIIGYDDDKKEFITHDPGTRRGENYRYSYKILWNSIHDFPGKKSDILKGAKNIILVEKDNH